MNVFIVTNASWFPDTTTHEQLSQCLENRGHHLRSLTCPARLPDILDVQIFLLTWNVPIKYLSQPYFQVLLTRRSYLTKVHTWSIILSFWLLEGLP